MKSKIIKPFTTFIQVAVIGLVITSCYPGGPEYTSDLDVTVTNYNPDYDFGSKKTYYMPDTVLFKTNVKNPDFNEADAQLIINAFENQFEAQGYTRVDSSAAQAPDFLVGLEVYTNETTGGTWYPGGWGGWYPGGWGWCWSCGWYYPPSYYVPYQYTTGTVVAFISDPNNPVTPQDGDESQPLEWTVALNGLASSKSSNASRIQNGVAQAFEQSPYIKSK